MTTTDPDPPRRGYVEQIEIESLEQKLRAVPPEALIDGAPDDADLLLPRTLRILRSLR